MGEEDLTARVGRALGDPPLSEMDERQRHELDGSLAEATVFEDLPGKWQPALLKAEAHRDNRARAGGAPERD